MRATPFRDAQAAGVYRWCGAGARARHRRNDDDLQRRQERPARSLSDVPHVDRMVGVMIHDDADGRPGGRDFFQTAEFLDYASQVTSF